MKSFFPRRTQSLGLCLLAFFGVSAADSARTGSLLTPDEAVRLGLQNNYSIALARDQRDLAAGSRLAGVGPFLPTASASATHTGELHPGSGTSNSAGASVNLQLFNGFQSYYAYQRLKTQETAAGLQEQLAVEATLESVLSSYYAIATQKRQIAALRELLAVSRQRAALAEARLQVGAGSRLEQLQSQADLNADSSSLLSQEMSLREAKVRLNQLLARDPAEPFDVEDTIPVEPALPVAAWRGALLQNNTTLREARLQRSASETSLREARGGYSPTVSAGLAYRTSLDSLVNGGGAGTVTASDALTYSVSLSIPLFDGLRTRQNVVGSRIGLRRQETLLKQSEAQVRADFEQAEGRYVLGLRQIALEEGNLEVARRQAEAARERFRVGSSSSLEFRDAQQKLLSAQSRLATARQSAKLSELALKRLAGALAVPVQPSAPVENP
ncbi:MAG: transporter [Fibrobacteria bacterium]|jgi:outer membrane protein TolC|nr:transporter [Fibrobacteria bacterium]